MKKIYFLFLTLILIGLAGEVWAVPQFPHTFYGTIKKDGANIPAGTVVSAWIGGVQYASTTTLTSGADSVYALNVPGDDPDTPAKEGGVSGEIISFQVGGQTADQTAIFSSGEMTHLDIKADHYVFTIDINLSGAGSVSKSPDKPAYVYGDVVTLTVTGNPGYTFNNWTGGVPNPPNSSNQIQITVTGNTAVAANFTQDQYNLTVGVNPAGKGLVTKSPDKATYVYGDVVTLTAVGNPGYTFSDWTGGVPNSPNGSNPVQITITGNTSVGANFTQDQYNLTVDVSPTGKGLVTKSPDNPTYVYGDVVTLTATGNPGYTFSNWTGGVPNAPNASNPVQITVTGNTSVGANFTQDQYNLTVGVNPAGKGLVTKNPDKPTYVYGDVLTLTAAGNPGYTFSDWTGGVPNSPNGSNPVQVTITGNTSVAVNFTQDQYSLTVSVSPTGKGSVTKSPEQATYVYGDVVTLTATGNPGYTFSGWGGGTSGMTNPVTVTMNGNTAVTANFVYSLQVSLKAGYNLVSFPTIAGDIAITDLLSSISGQSPMVYAYEACDPAGDLWKIYDSTLPDYVNDLQYVDSAMGLWIEVDEDVELPTQGLFSATLSIPLCVGWNLISYAGEQAKPVAEALSSISGKYDRVYSYRADDPADPWKIYDVSVPSYVNDLVTLQPGVGYWIHVSENCTLVINN